MADDTGDKRARKVQRLLSDPDSFISAIQVGITFAGFFNSASASQAFVGRLAPALGRPRALDRRRRTPVPRPWRTRPAG